MAGEQLKMLTLSNQNLSWYTLFKVIAQENFDPKVLEFESQIKGFLYTTLPKSVFIGIMNYALCNFQHIRDDGPIYKWGNDSGRYEKYVTYVEWFRNFSRFILETSYFDKWLVSYRLVSEESVIDFCEFSLKSWSKSSSYRYEDANPKIDSVKVKQAWDRFVRDIIGKTQKLLKKRAKNGNK